MKKNEISETDREILIERLLELFDISEDDVVSRRRAFSEMTSAALQAQLEFLEKTYDETEAVVAAARPIWEKEEAERQRLAGAQAQEIVSWLNNAMRLWKQGRMPAAFAPFDDIFVHRANAAEGLTTLIFLLSKAQQENWKDAIIELYCRELIGGDQGIDFRDLETLLAEIDGIDGVISALQARSSSVLIQWISSAGVPLRARHLEVAFLASVKELEGSWHQAVSTLDGAFTRAYKSRVVSDAELSELGRKLVDVLGQQNAHAGAKRLVLDGWRRQAFSEVLNISQIPRREPRLTGIDVPGMTFSFGKQLVEMETQHA